MFSLFKWFFSTSGIQYTTAKPFQVVLFGKRFLYFNPLPGVECRPKGPTLADTVKWGKWQRVLRECRCKFCGTKVWSWKRVKVCGRFGCFRKNRSKWN